MLMQLASSTLKKCSFELGGNAPFIVFDDADIDQTVDGLLTGKFRGSGQTCVSPNRVFVQKGIHDRLVEAIRKRVEADMQPRPLDDPAAIMGSLINQAAADRIDTLISDAVSKGAKVVSKGEPGQNGTKLENHVPATVLTDMGPQMRAYQEEIFGPLLAVYRFESEKEVVRLANESAVGLAAYVYTTSLPRAWRVAEGLEGLYTSLLDTSCY